MILKGSNLVLTETSRSYEPGRGYSTVLSYRGSAANVDGVITELIAARVRFRVVGGSGASAKSLEVEIPDGIDVGGATAPQIEESWDLDWTELDRPLRLHPRYLSEKTNIEKVEADIANGKLTATTNYGSSLANEYRDKRLAGVESYRAYAPVLTHSLTAASRAAVAASCSGVGSVQAIAPNSQLHKLGDTVGLYQWLKLPAKKRLENGRISIVQTYLGAIQWDQHLYSGGTGDVSRFN